MLLTTHPLLVPRSRKSRAIPLPTLWATPGLQRDHFTYYIYIKYEKIEKKAVLVPITGGLLVQFKYISKHSLIIPSCVLHAPPILGHIHLIAMAMRPGARIVKLTSIHVLV